MTNTITSGNTVVTANAIRFTQLDATGRPIESENLSELATDEADTPATDQKIVDVTEDGTTVTASVEDASPPPKTMPMNRHILRALGSCDQGVRQFRNAFPGEDVTVEIRRSVCVDAAHHLDWDWIVQHMLNFGGQSEFDRIRRSRATEFDYHGRGRENAKRRKASIFGELFENHPNYRSDLMDNAVARADEFQDEQRLQEYRRAERHVTNARNRIVDAKQTIEHWTAKLPNLEDALARIARGVAPILARNAERTVKQSEAGLRRLEQTIDEHRREHKLLVEYHNAQVAIVKADADAAGYVPDLTVRA